jgi:hypothetical protein
MGTVPAMLAIVSAVQVLGGVERSWEAVVRRIR